MEEAGGTGALGSTLLFFPRVWDASACRLPGRYTANAPQTGTCGCGFGEQHRCLVCSQTQGRKTRTQQPSRSGADGACQSGTNSPGKSRVPWAPRQHPRAVIPPVPAPIHPWGPGAHGQRSFCPERSQEQRLKGQIPTCSPCGAMTLPLPVISALLHFAWCG